MPANVLIVEDDPFTRDGLRDLLQDHGYTVCCAGNGRDGLAAFESFSPDLVCLDIMMPD